MNFAYSLSGGAPVIKKYRVATASSAVAGGYVTGIVANGSGVVLGLATTVIDQVGHTLDAATGAVTPTSDTAAVTSVVVNNDAVYKFLIVKGATGGQLDVLTESVGGSRTVNTITTAETAPNSPEMDEGTIVCISGVNKGQVRKITSTAATTATTVEGWVNLNAIGDMFLLLPFTPADIVSDNINLTTDLTAARADVAYGTGADFRVIELQVDQGSTYTARNQSLVFGMFDDLLWRETT